MARGEDRQLASELREDLCVRPQSQVDVKNRRQYDKHKHIEDEIGAAPNADCIGD